MRILILNSEYPPLGGGAGNASACLAAELTDLGNEVLLLTSSYRKFALQEEIPTRGKNCYQLKRLPALRLKEERSNALEQGSFMVTAALFGLPIVRRWQPQVVIAFFGVPCGASALLWKWVLGIPYIVSLRGGDVPGFRPYDFALYHRLMSPLIRMVWKQSEALVANGSGLRELAHAFDPSASIEVIPNGVDGGLFYPNAADSAERKQDASEESLHLLFVGRLVYQKGLDILFNVLGRLKGQAWRLTIVGDGPMYEPLKALARALGMEERIQFLGWVHRDQLSRIYRQADVFVFPSRHEGMSNVVLEAMASGLAVIATDIAGNQELVVPNETGYLVAKESEDDLYQALEFALKNRQQLKLMGCNARRRVEQHFSWSSTAKQYLALLKKLEGIA